jgi:hypothetical protein
MVMMMMMIIMSMTMTMMMIASAHIGVDVEDVEERAQGVHDGPAARRQHPDLHRRKSAE